MNLFQTAPFPRRRRGRRGYTLAEVLVALGIFGLLTLGFMGLYIGVLRSSASVVNIVSTNGDAANAIQNVDLALKEARRFELMDGGTYGSTYLATDSNGNPAGVTGIHIVFPATFPVTAVVNGTNVNMPGLMDIRRDGATLDIYRADQYGNPAPNNGRYLWAKGTLNGESLPTQGRALTSMLAEWVGAVQFIQPYDPASHTPVRNRVQIKIVTGAYDRVRRQVTSEATRFDPNAPSSQIFTLVGENVYLRNHDPNGAYSGAAHGRQQFTGH
jgi:prepilin-type N-terminal cleavage/methylation domain-containing protein